MIVVGTIRWIKPLAPIFGMMIFHTDLLAYGDAVIAYKTTPTGTLFPKPRPFSIEPF